MDIWAWVHKAQEELYKNGHHRLASLIDDVSSFTVNDEHAKVDALMPEALALVQQVGSPWLELFFRHWHLQSRILYRREGKTAIGEAVSLVEFAHRKETEGCPQAICSIQDLSSCYEVIDGPGFVEERKKVVDETLARIDPSWPCFSCLSAEYVDALIEEGKCDDALEFIKKQTTAMQAHGKGKNEASMHYSSCDAYEGLGEYEKALAMLDDAEKYGWDSAHRQNLRKNSRANIYACMGKFEEAKATLPDFEVILPVPSFYMTWVKTVQQLVEAKVIENEWSIGVKIQQLLHAFLKKGTVRRSIDLAEIQASLAISRGSREVAAHAIGIMENLVPSLHKPLDAPQKIERLKLALEQVAASSSAATGTADEMLASILGNDPEQDLSILRQGLARFPDHESLALTCASALQALLMVDEAEDILRRYFLTHPTSSQTALRLAQLLRERGDLHGFQNFAETLVSDEKSDLRAAGHFALGRKAYEDGDFERGVAHLRHVIELWPNALNSRYFMARSLTRLGRYEEALTCLHDLIQKNAEPGSVDWERMLVGTILERFEEVRDSAKRLGANLEGEGPIVEDWGLCRIQFAEVDSHGRPVIYYAHRSGPVTARIVQLASPKLNQHYGEVVAFDATPLNAPPREGEEESHSYVYPAIKVLQISQYMTFDLDGLHPGEEVFKELSNKLEALGCVIQKQSNDEYQIEVSDEEERPGIYAFLAVPTQVRLEHVVECIKTTLQHAQAEDSLVYLALAEAVGDFTLTARQRELATKYDLLL